MNEVPARKRGRPRGFHDQIESKIVQSVDRAMVLLKIVSESSGISLSDIVETSQTPAATAYRALITMQGHGLVTFDETTQLWRIDVGAFRIGSTFLTNTSIVEQARPVMQQLMETTGETANIGIISNREVVFLIQVETHQPIRAFFRPGTNGSIHASGIGKALFSNRGEKQAAQLAHSLDLEQFTPNTIFSVEQMMTMRTETLTQGFAVDDGERTIGMRCIAAPIFNNFSEAVAAISVSGPTVRMETNAIPQIGLRVREAADQITRNVGGNTQSFLN